MNWLFDTSWLWKALRGQSITFAMLFALSILGLSVGRAFRHLLAALGAPWLLFVILPILLIGAVARREEEWIPDKDQRKRWSRRLVFGAIGISVLIALVTPKPPHAPSGESSVHAPVRTRGPSGK